MEHQFNNTVSGRSIQLRPGTVVELFRSRCSITVERTSNGYS